MFELSGARDALVDVAANAANNAEFPDLPEGWWTESSEEFLARECDGAVQVQRLLGLSPGGWISPIGVQDVDLPQLHELTDEQGTADPVAVLAALTAMDPVSLPSDFDVVELLAAWQRVESWVQAAQERVLLTFARRPMSPSDREMQGLRPLLVGEPGDVSREFVAEELAPRLGASARSVSQRLGFASHLVSRFPAAHAQRCKGHLDRSKAQILVRECATLDVQTCARVELRVLGEAEQQSPTQFGRAVRKQVAVLDPAANQKRHESEGERRGVWVEPAADGMAWLSAFLPADKAAIIHTALTAAATRAKYDDPAEQRSMSQLRADLLAWPFDLALRVGALAGPVDQELSRSRGSRPQIQVTASMTMLMGLDDQPAELRGYGPIPASMARRIAADGTWRRLLTDPVTGVVLDVGTTTYAPPTDLLRLVQARDQHCRFPGCSRPAIACDVDHVVPFPHGPTADTNLAALCRRHHRFKHHDPDASEDNRSGSTPAITIDQQSRGILRWRLPSGHEYTVRPENIGEPDCLN